MNPQERLDLKKLMDQSDYEDNTEGIRKLKHSDLIQAEIIRMEKLKKTEKEFRETNPTQFLMLCQEKCSFLYNSYTDIFTRVVKDELDIGLMDQTLTLLKKIEQGEIDQQEGSVMMGKLLHRVFVESALKRAEHLDIQSNNNEDTSNPEVPINNGKTMSWREYKRTTLPGLYK